MGTYHAFKALKRAPYGFMGSLLVGLDQSGRVHHIRVEDKHKPAGQRLCSHEATIPPPITGFLLLISAFW
jgi:hypothetical protein